MSSTLQFVLAAIFLVIVYGLFLRGAAKQDSLGILLAEFATAIEPEPPFTTCTVYFPPQESRASCMVRATPTGWYMRSPADLLAKRSMLWNVPVLTQPVLIPWHALNYHRAQFPMRGWLRFDVAGTKASFFVKWEVVIAHLKAAGQPLPAD